MFLLELDPNIVKPGWTPFLITIGLAAVMYLLFRSMRRQFRRVDANYPAPADEQPVATESDPETDPRVETASAVPPVEGVPPRR